MVPINLLSLIQNPDSKIRKNAEIKLNHIEKKNFEVFIFELSKILADENSDLEIRTMAGIIIKNKIGFFSQKKKKKDLKKIFNTLRNLKKKGIEKNLTKTLNSSSTIARKMSAQIIARIIQIELSVFSKSEMIWILKKILKTSNFDLIVFHSILETIQFICQDVSSGKTSIDLFKIISVEILRIVIHGINQTSENLINIKIAAMKALSDGLGLFNDVLENPKDRDFIFRSITNQLGNCSLNVQQLIFELFDKIVDDYYFNLEIYMPLLFDMTLFSLNYPEEQVSVQAIEFWSSVSEKEFDIIINAHQALYEGRAYEKQSFFFISKASFRLPLLLFDIIQKKNQNFENDEWNFNTSAGNCLNLMSQAAPLEVIGQLIPFLIPISEAYNDYSSLEGKILAFGAIFDGMGSKILYQTVEKILPNLLLNLENTDLRIRNVTSWLIGKIESFCPYSLREIITRLIRLLFKNIINDQVIEFPYYSFSRIIISYGIEGILDWCYEGIFSTIVLSILVKFDQKKKIHELLEILCLLLLNASIREKSYVYSSIPFVFSKFKEIVNFFGKLSQFEIQTIQIQLCRFLNIAIQMLGPKINYFFIQQVLEFMILLCSASKRCHSEWFIEEEIIMCIGLIVNRSQKKIFFLLKNWFPFLLNRAANVDDNQISSLSISLLGDLGRIYSKEIEQFVVKTIEVLSKIVKSKEINQNIKLSLIECLGDISFATESYSLDFIKFVMPFFCLSSFLPTDPISHDHLDFLQTKMQFKEALVESISSILSNHSGIHTIYDFEKTNFISNFEWICEFIYRVYVENRNERLTAICIGLIGDCNKRLFLFKKAFFYHKWVFQLLFETKYNKEDKIKTLGKWTSSSFIL